MKCKKHYIFSSLSVAQHHLEQLREIDLVQKQDVGGHYYLVGEVKIGVKGKITHIESGVSGWDYTTG